MIHGVCLPVSHCSGGRIFTFVIQKFIYSGVWYLVTVQLLGNFLKQHCLSFKVKKCHCLLQLSLLSSDTWIQHLPSLQKRSAHTRCWMHLDFSTALVVPLSTGLSSLGLTVFSSSSQCAMLRVYHNVAL